ncbi:MAG: Flp pilus assembly complex ATPase component TadA [Chthoniobacterales bacterium]|nr:Flp pilus assembly complex ATPase component TadA [Chthoniobacterales bacterium]
MHTEDQVLEVLLDHVRVTHEQIAAARENHPGAPVLDALVEDGALQPRDVHEAIAFFHGLTFADLDDEETVSRIRELRNLIPGDVARRHHILPLQQSDHGLQVAIGDPMNFEAFDTIPFLLKTEIEFLYANPDRVEALIASIYPRKEGLVAAGTDEEAKGAAQDDAAIITLVQDFLERSQEMRASDIHLEPVDEGFRIRFRIDGELELYKILPPSLQSAVISRLKIMTETMSIDEKRVPQDGRIQCQVHGKALDLRVSTVPTSQGESIVMRLLDQSTLSITLPDLGFMSDDQEYFRGLIKLADGIILVTGPTGSGKTTTLYACLSEINDETRKIITVEDPIEYVMPGVNQVHVKSDIGMTFARALRSMLRQAPNVIMIGEIRDLETAGIAINASLTGHLVLSTLHTNDAPSAIARLIDIGVKPFLVSSAVRAVMAQRLCRKLCTCKEPAVLTEAEMISLHIDSEQLSDAKIFKPKGCERCRFTGYRGRLGIFEIFKVDDEMRQMINRMGETEDRSEQVSTVQLRRRAREQGMRTLREDGFQKVFAGLTTFDEVLAVTMGDTD